MTATILHPPMNKSLTLPVDGGAVPITYEQWRQMIGGEPRDILGDIKTVGPWHIPVSFRALAISMKWGEHSIAESLTIIAESLTIYGWRTMSEPKQNGYHLEGRASVHGKKYSAFSSSQLFRLPDGKLFDVATIHLRLNQQ